MSVQAAGKSQTPPSRPSEQELAAAARSKQNELQALVAKIGELEREAEEHALVIETLREAHASEPDRKCFRLVGGVLVERTVKDVLPELEGNHEQLKGVLGHLLQEYKKKESEFGDWQRANDIEVKMR